MSDEPINVLLVEDNPGDARLIRELLAQETEALFDLNWADRLSAALERLAAARADVVLLDLSLPDSEGLDTLLRVQEQAPAAPVVVLTGTNDDALALRALQSGAQDYLVKGNVDSSLLVRSLRYAVERRELATKIQVMNELMRVAVSSLDLFEVFDGVSMQVKRLVDHDRLSLSVHRPNADYIEQYAVAAEGEQLFGRGTRFPLHETDMGEVIRTGRPIMRKNSLEESLSPHERAVAKRHGLRSAMCVPLKSKDRVIGTLTLASGQPGKYSERELQIAQEIANCLAVVVENTLLHQETKEVAALQERSRLANELHDALAQSFIGIILELDLAERMMRTDGVAARREVERARQMAHEGLEEARRSVLALRPSALDARPLHKAVAAEIESLASGSVTVNWSCSGTPVPLANELETALCRIAQEAVTNIRSHAHASRIDALLDYGEEALTLTIVDNGVGFDTASHEPSDGTPGFGLTSMRERARAVGGRLRVESEPGRGTRVTVHMPCEGAAAPRLEPPLEANGQSDERSPIRVLLADDHPVTRQGVCRMLEEETDIEVVGEAGDGREALAKARALRPDVLVADIKMPGLGGIELVSAVKEDGLATQCIILTTFLQGRLVSDAMKAGAQGYLLKDAGGPELVNCIRAVHRGDTFLQPAAASELGRRLRDTGDRGIVEDLTPRELEVLGFVAQGKRNKEIARELSLTEATVKFHVAHIFEKLGVNGRTEAVGKAIEVGIINPQAMLPL